MFSTVPERRMRYIRGFLALAWVVLIVSLFWDPLTPHLTNPENEASPFHLRDAPVYVQGKAIPEQAYPMGARIFWTMLIPIVPFFLLLFGHEAWRRICPLSFMTQIPQYLGIQLKTDIFNRRTGGIDRSLNLVKAESWLGRNFWNLQFFFLYSGISGRLVFINSDRLALAIFLIALICMAVLVGFVFGGKTWCNYICPISPVQKIYTEPRGVLESKASTAGTQIAQSTCRTYSKDGPDQSACVGCISPCPDVDSERTYWEGLDNKGRRFFYFGYFGLVLGFYTYYLFYSCNWNYYFSGAWTHEPSQMATLFSPGFCYNDVGFGIPKIFAAPLTLAVFILLSQVIWRGYARLYQAIKSRGGRKVSREAVLHHSYTVAAWSTINTFYVFGGRPNLNLLPPMALFVVDATILVVTTVWLWRTLSRKRVAYERETLVSSFRRQLKKLKFNFKEVFDGRDIEDLDTDEVYVLAKTLPGFDSNQRRQVYKDVLRENMTGGGKVDATTLKSSLRDLRRQLDLSDSDHHELQESLELEMSTMLDWKETGSQQNWVRLNNYHAALEQIFVRLMDSGIPIKEALNQKDVKSEIHNLKNVYNVTEEQHQELIAVLTGDNNLLLNQATALLDHLKDFSARILALTEKVPDPDSAVMRLCRSFLHSKRMTVTSQLLNILTSVGDHDDAVFIAQSLHEVVPTEVKEILESSNRLVEGHSTQWEEHISPRVLEALLQLKGDRPVKADAGLVVKKLTVYEIREVIPKPAKVLEDIYKENNPVPSATALFALAKLHPQKGRSLANQLKMQKKQRHWLLTQVAENILGINISFKENMRYTIQVDIESPGHPKVTKRFRKSAVTIGRSTTNDIVVLDQSISQRHAVIRQADTRVQIEDLGSAQGTKVDNKMYRTAAADLDQPGVVTLGSLGGGVKLIVTLKESDLESDVGSSQADYRRVDSDTMTTMLRLYDSKFFNHLSPEVLAELARGAELRMYRRDGVICRLGDTSDKIFVVSTGNVNVYIEVEGKRKRVDQVLPGESIGEMGIFTQQPRSTTCVAGETDTLMISIEGYDLMSIVGDNSKVAASFLTILSERQQQIINKLMRRAS